MSTDLRGFMAPAAGVRQVLEWRLIKLQSRRTAATDDRDREQAALLAVQAQLRASVEAMRPAQAQSTAVHALHLERVVGGIRAASLARQAFDLAQEQLHMAQRDCQDCQLRLLGIARIQRMAQAAFIAQAQRSSANRLDADVLARSAWQRTQEGKE